MRSATWTRVRYSQVALVAAVWLSSGLAMAELEPLRTAAALSPRPDACRSFAQSSVWRGVRPASGSSLALWCARMANIGRLLTTDAAAAEELVTDAAGLAKKPALSGLERASRERVPRELEVPYRLLRARVALANGRALVAYKLFHQTAIQLPISGWDPATLRDYATSALAQAEFSEVLRIYRRLVAVSTWLDVRTRVGVRVEAAVAVLRLPKPDTVEAMGYLTGLDARDSDSALEALVQTLRSLIRSISTGASAEPEQLTVSVKSLRQLARLSELDWRLIESWSGRGSRPSQELWGWTREATVPESYRTFASEFGSGD